MESPFPTASLAVLAAVELLDAWVELVFDCGVDAALPFVSAAVADCGAARSAESGRTRHKVNATTRSRFFRETGPRCREGSSTASTRFSSCDRRATANA